MAEKKYVFDFEEGDASKKDLLGGKGANLAEMTRLGFPVPPGFTVTTEACKDYLRTGGFPEGLWDEIVEAVRRLEQKTNKKLGDAENPLLVSVRSGAPLSMPGMMDTVLNLGLNNETVKGLIKNTGDERFAYDSYRRFIQMFSDIVLKVERNIFEKEITKKKEEKGVKLDTELTAEDWKELVERFKEIVREETGEEFPTDPWDQLRKAVEAVFNSWNNPRAQVYRRINKISDDLGTAVNVQAMVFGNMGNDSATGVCFTRNPSTGEKELFGEYLVNAQGEDVVAGIRTPQPIQKMKEEIPEAFEQLLKLMDTLEKHYRDMQDIEFTVEKGKLYMLQTRSGKRTAKAAVRIAVEMVHEGLINKEEAVMRVKPEQLDQLLHPQIDPNAKVEVLTKGLPASPGAATGKVVFDADLAEELGKKGEKVILVRWETTPDDIHGIVEAQGILTSHGGMTSHAAVVARGMGKPCVVGAEEVKINEEAKLFKVGDVVVREGDIITIDGSTGNVMLGEVPVVQPELTGELEELLKWADEIRKIGVRTNADTPEDARRAREFGAEGIGLCRTEHMFFGENRLPIVRQMILAEDEESRKEALDKLLPMQRGDFEGIFREMNGLPVTIRLLDPPLHEFLPSYTELSVKLVEKKLGGASKEEVEEIENLARRVKAMSEMNPMLGLRGCRLGLVFPGVYEMQVKAIIEAAINVKKQGYEPVVEITIPLVALAEELRILKERLNKVAKEVIEREGIDISYKFGTMIELPRAALTADEIAEHADFFSFGTNDLTQTTFGFSRDDAEGKFLPRYLEEKILKENPFEVLDKKGVGKLLEIASELGRSTNPELKLGICGEHGGEPSSIEFAYKVGLDYVSCSPFRVPIARLAAAQATLKNA
ncbi:MAG: pyruvate, phosphate dikinase [Actinobacteria bacterium]|nr:pyruvate, phosphate dikinase [Actinomycetota bacterium]